MCILASKYFYRIYYWFLIDLERDLKVIQEMIIKRIGEMEKTMAAESPKLPLTKAVWYTCVTSSNPALDGPPDPPRRL